MPRLWIKTIEKHKIARQCTVPCVIAEVEETLVEACREMDLPAPIWLNKQLKEFDSFRHTSFLPENFIEEVGFQKLEIEYLDDSGKKRRSNDPRNDFSL